MASASASCKREVEIAGADQIVDARGVLEIRAAAEPSAAGEPEAGCSRRSCAARSAARATCVRLDDLLTRGEQLFPASFGVFFSRPACRLDFDAFAHRVAGIDDQLLAVLAGRREHFHVVAEIAAQLDAREVHRCRRARPRPPAGRRCAPPACRRESAAADPCAARPDPPARTCRAAARRRDWPPALPPAACGVAGSSALAVRVTVPVNLRPGRSGMVRVAGLAHADRRRHRPAARSR